MHYVDWSGGQHGHLLYDPFEDEAALLFGNHHHICPEMKKALQGVFLIAEQKKRIEESTKVRKKEEQLANHRTTYYPCGRARPGCVFPSALFPLLNFAVPSCGRKLRR